MPEEESAQPQESTFDKILGFTERVGGDVFDFLRVKAGAPTVSGTTPTVIPQTGGGLNMQVILIGILAIVILKKALK